MNRFTHNSSPSRLPAGLFWALFLAFLVTLQGCSTTPAKSMDSPEATLSTLKSAIDNHDIDTYEALWHPGRKEKEGLISKLKADDKVWEALAELFKGEVTIKEKEMFEQDGNKMCKLEINASEAAEGGIGSLTMIKVDDDWLMWTW